MSLDADLLFDRRRLKRQLSFWRVAAIGAGLLAALVAFGSISDTFERTHIARLSVEGLILEDQSRDDAIRAAADDPKIAALVVTINSPGGTVVGGEDLYRALVKLGEKKPVVAVLGTLATSAAYMTAIAADRVYAREGTTTGSIGVIMQTAEVTGLLGKLGISAEAIKSSPLKAAPSPLEVLTPDARAAARAVVDDMQVMFIGMVAERRKLDAATAQRLSDGRVYTGRLALATKLLDAIGDEAAARDWLERERNIAKGLPVRALTIRRESAPFAGLASAIFGNTFLSEGLILDGLGSVWHPDLTIGGPRGGHARR